MPDIVPSDSGLPDWQTNPQATGRPGVAPPLAEGTPTATPEAPSGTWRERMASAHQRGISWENLETVQQEKYNDLRQRGVSADNIATAMGYTPESVATRQVAQGLEAAYQRSTQPKASPLQGVVDAAQHAFENFKIGAAALATRNAQLTAQAKNEIATATNQPNFGTGPFEQGLHSVLAATQAAGGVFDYFTAPEHAYIDLTSGQALSQVSGGAIAPDALGSAVDTVVQFLLTAEGGGAAEASFKASLKTGVDTDPMRAVNAWYAQSDMNPDSFISRALRGDAAGLNPQQTAALRAHFPAQTDFTDAAMQIAGPVPAKQLVALADRLKKHWVETGERPMQAAARAQKDQPFHQELMTGAWDKNPVPPGSARVAIGSTSPLAYQTAHGPTEFVLPKQEAAAEAESGLLPQVESQVLGNIKADPQGWIEHYLGKRVRMVAEGATQWDFTPAGTMKPETAALAVTDKLRAENVPFDSVTVTPTHVEIRFGGAARGEIFYKGVKPGPKASGVELTTTEPPTVTGKPGATDFQGSLAWIMREEGGLTKDTGGVTNFGISQRANPDINPANLTRGEAAEIYRTRYWDAIHADSLPPEMRLAAFDSAVNEGVGATREWLAQAHGDLGEFMRLRMEKYAELEKLPQYAKYADAWRKRINDLGIAATSEPELAEGETEERGMAGFVKSERGSAENPLGEPTEPERGVGTVWERIADGQAAPNRGKGFLDRLKDNAQITYREMLNPAGPVEKLIKAAQGAGTLPEDSRLPAYLLRAAEYAPSKAIDNLIDKQTDINGNVIGDGLHNILRPFINERGPKNFGNYLLARQALDYGERGLSHPIDAVDAHTAILDAERSNPEYKEAFSALTKFQNNTLDWLADDRVGLLSKDSVNRIKAERKNYVPAAREKGQVGGTGTGQDQIAFNPVKRAGKGSEDPIKDILQQIQRQTIQRRVLAQKAMASNASVALARDIGVLEASKGRPVKITLTGDELDKLGVRPDEEDEDASASLYRTFAPGMRDDKVPLFENGKMSLFEVDKEAAPEYQKIGRDLVSVLHAVDPTMLRNMLSFAKPFARLLRNTATIAPSFAVHILGYDTIFQGMTHPDIGNIARVISDGIVNVFGKTETYDEARRLGLMQGALDRIKAERYITDRAYIKDPTMVNRLWNVPRSTYEALNSFRAKLAEVVPTGVYAGAKRRGEVTPENLPKLGYSMSEAVFHRQMAGGRVGREINGVWPFLMAHLTGIEKAFRNIGQIPKAGMRLASFKQVYGWGALIATAAVTDYIANKDQEWYKAYPDYAKDTTLPIHFGGDYKRTGTDENGNATYERHGFTIPLPIPPVMSLFFAALPRRIAAGLIEHDPSAADKIGESLIAGLSPPGGVAGITMLSPIIQGVTNHSMITGRPLVSDDMAHHLSPHNQYLPYTSGVAKGLAAVLGHVPVADHISPILIDETIKDWADGPGQVATQLADTVAEKAGIERPNNMPTKTVAEWPLWGSFHATTPWANGQPVDDAFDAMTKEEQTYGDMMQAFKEGNLPKFTELLKEHPIEASMHTFNITNGPYPTNADDFVTQINAAQQKVNPDDLNNYMEAKTAMRQAYKTIDFVNNLPIRSGSGHVDASNMMEASSITNDDKRQLLGTLHASIQLIAEGFLKRADKVNLK